MLTGKQRLVNISTSKIQRISAILHDTCKVSGLE